MHDQSRGGRRLKRTRGGGNGDRVSAGCRARG
jgi:hypothetical protein